MNYGDLDTIEQKSKGNIMDKQQLSRLKKLNKEAEIIRKEIDQLKFKPREYVADTVKDYRTGYPVTIVIEGYGDEEYVKANDRLYSRLAQKLREIQREREQIENYLEEVEDPEMRVLLRLRYINGLTQEQIADEMNYSLSTIKRRLKER